MPVDAEDLVMACPICEAPSQAYCLGDDGVSMPNAVHVGRLNGGKGLTIQRLGEDSDGNGIFVQVVPLSPEDMAPDRADP